MHKDKPLISVIIPNYNHGKFLKERIDSVLNQTYQNFEVIILDDYSSDNSVDVINSYKDHHRISHIVFNKKNTGNTFLQWGKGLELARGEYICFGESDDYFNTNFLELSSQILAQNDNAALVFCQSVIINTDSVQSNFLGVGTFPNPEMGVDFNSDFCMKGPDFILKYLVKSNLIPNASAVLMRKSKLIEIGGAPLNMKLFGDWFTWIRLLCDGSLVCYLNQPLNFFRTHVSTVRNKVSQNYSTLLEYFLVYDLLIEKFPHLKKSIFDSLIFQYLKFDSNSHFSRNQKRFILKKLIKYNKNSWFYIFKSRIRQKVWGKGFQ